MTSESRESGCVRAEWSKEATDDVYKAVGFALEINGLSQYHPSNSHLQLQPDLRTRSSHEYHFKMKLSNTSILAAVIGFASKTLACADFQASVNDYQYLTSTLTDDGTETCHLNGYGDNTGYSKTLESANLTC